jgi:hypothetical protein
MVQSTNYQMCEIKCGCGVRYVVLHLIKIEQLPYIGTHKQGRILGWATWAVALVVAQFFFIYLVEIWQKKNLNRLCSACFLC